MADVVHPVFILTIHIHTIQNILFNGTEQLYQMQYLLRQYAISDAANDLNFSPFLTHIYHMTSLQYNAQFI